MDANQIVNGKLDGKIVSGNSVRIVLCSGKKEFLISMAEELVHRRLCACATVIPGAWSVYWWEGKVEKEEEALVLIKTLFENLEVLQKVLRQLHPYEVPEIIVITPESIGFDYLSWLQTILSWDSKR